MKKRLICAALCLLAPFLGSGFSAAKDNNGPLKVFVSILPQKYFVEKVGGDLVKVDVLVGPGQSPATYEPTPKQMAELARAKAFFAIGVPFENRLTPKIRSGFRNLTLVDTRKGIELLSMEAEHGHDHKEAADDHDHEAGTPDPHIWLDPILVKKQAATIGAALSKMDPANAGSYERNLKSFQADLDRVNAKIAKALAPVKGKEIFVFHPAYGYFAHRYGLKQEAVETGGKEPSARALARLIERAKAEGVRVIFVQPQFDRKNAETVAKAIGGAVVSLDPLAPDYIKNLEDMAEKVASALEKKKR